MTVKTYVDLGSKEVDVSVDLKDIRNMLDEAFAEVNNCEDDGGPNTFTIKMALNSIAGFLNAFDDDRIAKLEPAVRRTVAKYLAVEAGRFASE